jgi:cytochrome c-type biogenesis protein CcmE
LIIALELINDESKIINFISEFFNKHQIILTAGFKRHQEIHVTLSNALEFGIGKWEKLPDILFRYCKKVVAEGTFDQNILIVKAVFEKMSSKDEFIHKC